MTILKKTSKGYTLVELLLVVGLLAISVGVTSDILLSIVRSYSKTQVINELEQQANFVGLKIEKELRNADTAEVITTSPGGVNTPTLKITPRETSSLFICYRVRNPGQDSAYIERTANGTTSCDSSSWAALTSSGIGNVRIECTLAGAVCFQTTTSIPVIVNIGIKFRQGQNTADTTFSGEVDIANTIVIRETY